MKTRRILSLLTALVMALAVVPGLAFAADGESLPLLESYISSTTATGVYEQDGVADRPHVLSWAGGPGNGYRTSVIAFSAEGLSDDAAKATLKLKIHSIQSGSEGTAVTVYAMDPKKVDRTNAVKPDNPAANRNLGRISTSGKAADDEVTLDIDLTKYFELYPDADKIALHLANRDDIADCNVYGHVAFYGKNDTGNEPQLVPIKTTNVTVELKSGNTSLLSTAVKGLVAGDKYTPTENVAPAYLVAGGKLYARNGELPEVTVAEGVKATVEYTEGASFEAEAFEGGMDPILPASFAAVKDNALTTVAARGRAASPIRGAAPATRCVCSSAR